MFVALAYLAPLIIGAGLDLLVCRLTFGSLSIGEKVNGRRALSPLITIESWTSELKDLTYPCITSP